MNLEGLLILVAVIGVAVFVMVVSRRTRSGATRCPQCGSRRYGVASKEPLGVRKNDHSAGQHAGGLSAIVLMFNVSYRCADCGAGWTETISESR